MAAVYIHDVTTIVPLGKSCHAVTYGSQVTSGRTVAFPLGSLHRTFRYYETWFSGGGGFQAISSWISPSRVSQVCGVFSSRVFPSSSGRQPRAADRSWYCLGSLLGSDSSGFVLPMFSGGLFVVREGEKAIHCKLL